MDFKDAVNLYSQNPTDENLYSVANKLCAQLKTGEKLHMLSGQHSESTEAVKI